MTQVDEWTLAQALLAQDLPSEDEVEDEAEHGVPPLDHACTWPGCCRRFASSANCAQHYRMHTDDLPYACMWPGCGKRFRTATYLKRHVQSHVCHSTPATLFEPRAQTTPVPALVLQQRVSVDAPPCDTMCMNE